MVPFVVLLFSFVYCLAPPWLLRLSLSSLFRLFVSSLTHQLDIGLLVFRSLFSAWYSCNALILCYVDPSSAGNNIGLIVSYRQTTALPSGLGLRPERVFVLFLPFMFFPFSFLFLFISGVFMFPFPLNFSSVHTIPWICPWCYLVAGDTGWYTTACSYSFPCGPVWHCRRAYYFVLVCFLPSRCIFCYSLFCVRRQDFRQVG